MTKESIEEIESRATEAAYMGPPATIKTSELTILDTAKIGELIQTAIVNSRLADKFEDDSINRRVFIAKGFIAELALADNYGIVIKDLELKRQYVGCHGHLVRS